MDFCKIVFCLSLALSIDAQPTVDNNVSQQATA